MAIVSLNTGADATRYDTFKFSVGNGFERIKNSTFDGTGISPYKPFQTFIDQWAKPAISDAKESVSNAVSSVVGAAKDGAKDVADAISPTSPVGSGPTYSPSRPVVNSGATAAPSLDYLHADLAKHYGMDAQAAYSEALQNTQYERAVADLKRAGLNPVLAAGKVSPAGSFAAGNTLSSGAGSGSSGGRRGSGSAKYAMSSEMYQLLGVVGTIGGALAGAALTPKAPLVGASTGSMLGKQVVQSVAHGLSSVQSLSRK